MVLVLLTHPDMVLVPVPVPVSLLVLRFSEQTAVYGVRRRALSIYLLVLLDTMVLRSSTSKSLNMGMDRMS